jgi:2-amino-1-hydroxyethylphosphonate dioxygenase (glycine-forming)
MTPEKANSIVNEIFELYEKHGSEDYIGEPVSQIEHMCQAAQLAEAEGYPDEVILGAFFHDIGHLCEHIMTVGQMDGYGVVDHEALGGNFLRDHFFSEQVVRLVESHVRTKRYLTYKFPEYYEKLSPASRMTLVKQGGIMQEAEAIAFEADPLHELYIKIRQWDDEAKKERVPLPSLEKYRRMAVEHLLLHNG